MSPAPSPTPAGVRTFDSWVKRLASVLGLFVLAASVTGGVLYLIGDARWVSQVAQAQERRTLTAAREAATKEHAVCHEKIDSRLGQVEKDLAVLSVTLTAQKTAFEGLSRRLDILFGPPPARRGTP